MSEMILFQSMTNLEVSTNRNYTLRQIETQECDYSNMSTLAERLIEAREKKGWKKSELKRRAGLRSPSTLTELENGTITQSPQLPAIANALGVEVLWLQHGRGPKHKSQSVDPGPIAEEVARMVEEMDLDHQTEILHFIRLYRLKLAEKSQP